MIAARRDTWTRRRVSDAGGGAAAFDVCGWTASTLEELKTCLGDAGDRAYPQGIASTSSSVRLHRLTFDVRRAASYARCVSENAIIVVELSTPLPHVEGRLSAVRDWLLQAQIIEANARRDALWQPSEFSAGPRAVEVAPPLAHDHIRKLANNGVDFVRERAIHHPTENYEPPPCPACGVPADEDAHGEILEAWLEGDEPPFSCAACGKATAAGDWVAKFTFYVGNLAVRFNNWSDIDPDFLARIGERLGPRWRVVYEHS